MKFNIMLFKLDSHKAFRNTKKSITFMRTCQIRRQGPKEAGVLKPLISPLHFIAQRLCGTQTPQLKSSVKTKDVPTLEVALCLCVKRVKQVEKSTFLSTGYSSV